MIEIRPHSYAVGKLSLITLSNEERRVLSLSGVSVTDDQVQKFERFFTNGCMFHSEKYLRSHAVHNKACSFTQLDGSLGFGEVVSFYLSKDCEPFCLIRKYCIKTITFIDCLRPPRNHHIRQLKQITSSLLKKQLIEVDSTQRDVIAIHLKNIVKKCFVITIKHNTRNITYLIQLPNSYEIH